MKKNPSLFLPLFFIIAAKAIQAVPQRKELNLIVTDEGRRHFKIFYLLSWPSYYDNISICFLYVCKPAGGVKLGCLHSTEPAVGLRNMRSQLYSAAEYFELSYKNDDKKELISKTLKSYTLETLADAVNRLGLVSNNVNNLLHQEVNEISAAEFQVSCIEQVSSTQSFPSPPNAVVCDEPMQTYEGIHPPQEASKLRKHKTARRRLPPPPPVLSSYTLTWPLPRLGKTFLDKSKLIAQLQEDPNCALYDMERRENSQLQANRPFISDSWPKSSPQREAASPALAIRGPSGLSPLLYRSEFLDWYLGIASDVGSVQFPLFPDGGAVGDLHLHLHQDTVSRHSRAKNRACSLRGSISLGLKRITMFRGFFWKAARIGFAKCISERLSPWVALGCFAMGISIIIF
ncbi:hypothetical protein ZIOFF_055887 [Zingiber officinale]|uniref:Uncharacterized protein n=1 Tax=Zingiber officinale TaxID=94328 RepID=A0A8J5FX66_ZINOF|nr:hypothetical protein ZIOFF_055887 [Zingiber officinale]